MSPRRSKPKVPELRETFIVKALLLRLSLRRDVIAWRVNTGAVLRKGTATSRRGFIRYNRPGAADISGLVAPWGCRLEIEVKRPSNAGGQTDDQQEFQKDVEAMGGIYILTTSAEDGIAQLEAKLAKLRERPRPTVELRDQERVARVIAHVTISVSTTAYDKLLASGALEEMPF